MRIRLALLAALIASPAFAADEPVATASKTAPPPSVAEQIDAYLKTSPALEARDSQDIDGVVPREDRKVHGVVSVGVGTGGYRSVYMQAEAPIGDNARVSVAFEDTRYGRSRGRLYGGGQFEGGSLGLPGVADRQRCDLEGMSPARPLDVTGGPHGRCVTRIPTW